MKAVSAMARRRSGSEAGIWLRVAKRPSVIARSDSDEATQGDVERYATGLLRYARNDGWRV